ncbi:MAG: hypothetical protein AABZ44_05830, partial [Elusimicrobiota bacterium]
ITSVNDYPNSGKHRAPVHMVDMLGWPQGKGFVQCFWCHGGDSAKQGTYGTVKHLDGKLDFHPYKVGSGGTVWNLSTKSYQDGHCGNTCHQWYP